jgi:hypothetical protein
MTIENKNIQSTFASRQSQSTDQHINENGLNHNGQERQHTTAPTQKWRFSGQIKLCASIKVCA